MAPQSHSVAWKLNTCKRLLASTISSLTFLATFKCTLHIVLFFKYKLVQDYSSDSFLTGYISNLMCTSSGEKFAPRLALSWRNTIDDYHSVLEFTYSVWHCHEPTLENKFCDRPLYGFSVYPNCSDMRGNSSTAGSEVVACNVTSLFMRLFPNLYDVHAQTTGRPSLFFTIALGNVHMPIIGSYSESVECSPLMKGMIILICLVNNYVNLWNPEFSCITAGSESSTS